MVFALYRTKIQISTPFLRDKRDPEILHTWLMCPCRALYECVIRWNCGIPQGPYIPKNTKKQLLLSGEQHKKQKTKQSWKARQGHVKPVRIFSGSYLSKAAWALIGLWRNLSFYAWTSPYQCYNQDTHTIIKMIKGVPTKGLTSIRRPVQTIRQNKQKTLPLP